MYSSLAISLFAYPRASRRSTSRSRSVSWSSSGSATGVPGRAANASSTTPASRGLNPASPSATRRIASTRSSGAMVFVTYPRAPARISPITSSAASDTDSARNRTCGCDLRTDSRTARPPPSGMCTSSSTTSGWVAAIAVTACPTELASPTTSTYAPSSARTPARNIAWSSTRNTRSRACSSMAFSSFRISRVASRSALVRRLPSSLRSSVQAPPRFAALGISRVASRSALVRRLPSSLRSSVQAPPRFAALGRHAQAYLGAAVRFAADLRRTAVPLHPAHDRATYPVPVRPDLGRVEPDPAVADEHAHRLRLHLGVQRHRRHLCMPGGVDQCFPGGGHQRRDPVIDVDVTDHHRLDHDRIGVLDLGDDLLDRGAEPLGRRGGRL